MAKLDAVLSRVTAGEAAARRAMDRLRRYRAAVLHAAVTGELTRDWRKTHDPDETGEQLLKRLLQERRARWEETELKRLDAAGNPPKDDKWKKRYPEPKLAKTTGLAALPSGWDLDKHRSTCDRRTRCDSKRTVWQPTQALGVREKRRASHWNRQRSGWPLLDGS